MSVLGWGTPSKPTNNSIILGIYPWVRLTCVCTPSTELIALVMGLLNGLTHVHSPRFTRNRPAYFRTSPYLEFVSRKKSQPCASIHAFK